MSNKMKCADFRTDAEITWCPGCPNHMILESCRRALVSLKKQGIKNFAMTTGIGCHGKIFDYLDIAGVYGLHGRAIPTAVGMKLGDPKLNVIAFAGDGDTYSEGMEHFIHACKNNPDMTLIVHDNRVFSLTTGQATPTSQKGYRTKAEPSGALKPINPIHIALASGATFVARCNARDIDHTQNVIEEAIKHEGFSFVEILQDCLIFNTEVNTRDDKMYKIKAMGYKKALDTAQEFTYDGEKIPIGIFYKEKREVLK